MKACNGCMFVLVGRVRIARIEILTWPQFILDDRIVDFLGEFRPYMHRRLCLRYLAVILLHSTLGIG